MPAIREGDTYPSLKEFKIALREWALENNWTPHILDSDSHRVRAGCRSSPDCPFRVRANYSDKRRNALVTTCDDNHNCITFRADGSGAHQAIKRAETGRLTFLLETVPRLIDITPETTIQEIIESVERRHGQKIPTRQAQKVKSRLCPRVRGPCRECHEIGHTRRNCTRVKGQMNGAVDDSVNDTWNDSTVNDTMVDDGMDMTAGEEDGDGHSYANAHPDTARQGEEAGHQGLGNMSNGQSQETPGQIQMAQMHPEDISRVESIDPHLSASYQTYTTHHQHRAPYALQNTVAPLPPDPIPRERTAREARLEASRMMQEAANLMEQAAKLNAEAAKLTASVAHI